MSYSVAQAAKAIGKSKATVLRAIQAGRISAARDDAGAFRVEPVELHRVFPPMQHEATHDVADDAERSADAAAEAREVRARLEAAEAAIRFRDEVIADLRQQRDKGQSSSPPRYDSPISAPTGQRIRHRLRRARPGGGS